MLEGKNCLMFLVIHFINKVYFQIQDAKSVSISVIKEESSKNKEKICVLIENHIKYLESIRDRGLQKLDGNINELLRFEFSFNLS